MRFLGVVGQRGNFQLDQFLTSRQHQRQESLQAAQLKHHEAGLGELPHEVVRRLQFRVGPLRQGRKGDVLTANNHARRGRLPRPSGGSSRPKMWVYSKVCPYHQLVKERGIVVATAGCHPVHVQRHQLGAGEKGGVDWRHSVADSRG